MEYPPPPHHDGRPDSGGLFVVPTPSSRRPPPPFVSLPSTTVSLSSRGSRCEPMLAQYNLLPSTISILCLVFGLLYCFFGYRYFKATMFLTGFLFGSLVTYLICLEENLLPLEGKLGVAVGAGVLCGLITMLVQYVGLFMTGFHFGFLLAVAGLVIAELIIHPSTKWIPIGAVLGAGVVLALLALYFQRGVTVLATSALGATLVTVSVDYFAEQFVALGYALERLKAERSEASTVCWYTWIVLSLVPVAFVLGATAQCTWTGKGFDHNEVVQTRRRRKANLRHVVEPTIEHRRFVRPSSYRHLYQIRRFNGDIIAQNYVCQVQEHPPPHRLVPR